MDKCRETEVVIEELENCFIGHDECILGLLAELKAALSQPDPRVETLMGALRKVRQDINWMLNTGEMLNGCVFGYIDEALTAAGASVEGE